MLTNLAGPTYGEVGIICDWDRSLVKSGGKERGGKVPGKGNDVKVYSPGVKERHKQVHCRVPSIQ